ncbi:DNA polymerase III subunit beta [Paenibacillus flagellatus]|uniref:Beta sliding clamp n=1 Tax=Paenibacillus flagellatus TaxID=2211139 RepID=A0A2V5JWW7_9BACL|nr:DNA polymerase III subunit beta [Paenibacillus flagellatus]PYI50702.1 DNA polymerase III subunit beta [Paenibacillus flagellatus]
MPMLAHIRQSRLVHALQRVMRALPAQSPMPILSGLYMEARPDGVTFVCSGFGLRMESELAAQPDDVRIETPGTVVIPAKQAYELVRKLPDGPVSFEAGADGRTVTIRTDATVCRLWSMSPDEYPAASSLEPDRHRIRLRSDELKTMIRQVAFAVSPSETRPILTGVSCRFDGGSVKLVASDGIRLASRQSPPGSGGDGEPLEVVVPGHHLNQLMKTLEDDGQAVTDISVRGARIVFASRDWSLHSALLEGAYPPTDNVVPRSVSARIGIGTAPFLQALERVGLLAGEGSIVRLATETTDDGRFLRLWSDTAELGDIVERLPIFGSEGGDFAVSFNGKYMLEIVRSIDCGALHLQFAGPLRPIALRPAEDGDRLFYVLTPIRTHV